MTTASTPAAALVPAMMVANPLMGRGELRSPLLWLGERIAKNRERLGVHYPSDSSGSRHLAAAIWRALLHDRGNTGIDCPTLRSVLRKRRPSGRPNGHDVVRVVFAFDLRLTVGAKNRRSIALLETIVACNSKSLAIVGYRIL